MLLTIWSERLSIVNFLPKLVLDRLDGCRPPGHWFPRASTVGAECKNYRRPCCSLSLALLFGPCTHPCTPNKNEATSRVLKNKTLITIFQTYLLNFAHPRICRFRDLGNRCRDSVFCKWIREAHCIHHPIFTLRGSKTNNWNHISRSDDIDIGSSFTFPTKIWHGDLKEWRKSE